MPEATRTVLLVEDNEENREIYTTILEHSGYEVIEAREGEQALRLARDRSPGIILLDISIPRIDGWEVAERLKADPDTRGIPIVALTAHALPEDHRRARAVGCDSYLAKPVRPREVLEEVGRLLEAGASSPCSGTPRPGSGPTATEV